MRYVKYEVSLEGNKGSEGLVSVMTFWQYNCTTRKISKRCFFQLDVPMVSGFQRTILIQCMGRSNLMIEKLTVLTVTCKRGWV